MSSPCTRWAGWHCPREPAPRRSALPAIAGTNTVRSRPRGVSPARWARLSPSAALSSSVPRGCCLTLSPYTCVPTAAMALARVLAPALNPVRARHGLPPAPLLRVDRMSASAGDYGVLSARARDRLMAANTLSFRRFRPELVRDAHLMVVDDVRVTGAHQRCLMRAERGAAAQRADLPLHRLFPRAGGRILRPRPGGRAQPRSYQDARDLAAPWRTMISPGTSVCASSSSVRPTATACRDSSAGCLTGSSVTCTATAARTVTPR